MSRRPIAALLVAAQVAAVLLAGCVTPPPPPPPPRTTVTLLPDEDGHVGAVMVTNAAGTERISEAFASSTAVGAAAGPAAGPVTAPTPAAPVGQAAVSAAHADVLKAQPPKPITFTLNFVLDRSVLTEASKAQLPALLAAVRERKPTEITVFGHADSSGTRERNLKLSSDRANAVADWLRKSDPSLDRIAVQFFGDAEPLVPTPPGMPEPRNRRAEVMVL